MIGHSRLMITFISDKPRMSLQGTRSHFTYREILNVVSFIFCVIDYSSGSSHTYLIKRICSHMNGTQKCIIEIKNHQKNTKFTHEKHAIHRLIN